MSAYRPRPRRPYEKKQASKGGALIFGMGLGAALMTVILLIGAAWPGLNARLENLPYYARTYYRKLVPHPDYLPTPALPKTPEPETAAQAQPPALPSPPPAATPEPAPTPSPVPPAAPAAQAIRFTPPLPAVQLTSFTHQWQTWNNCGPATITTNLSFFGRTETQAEAAPFLKPNKDDKNVNPAELAAYARRTGLDALVRYGGSLELLKTFLSNDLPVLVETWLVHDGDGLGHYRLITGYDDAAGQLSTSDSLNGPDFPVGYEQFEADWRVFNRLYLVVYPPEQAGLVAAIIGEAMDDAVMNERLLAQAQAEAAQNPADAIAFFNQGDALTRLGRVAEAAPAFDRARQLGLHWRRLWYQFTPFEAYYAGGRYQDVLDLTEATLRGSGGLEEAYYYHGLALLATHQAGVREDFEAALEYNPLFTPAAESLAQLAP
ncbi:MAG: C39 family peptidase [Chloroflexota bacterium]